MHTFSMHGSGQANQVCHVISPPSLPPLFFLLYVTKAIHGIGGVSTGHYSVVDVVSHFLKFSWSFFANKAKSFLHCSKS